MRQAPHRSTRAWLRWTALGLASVASVACSTFDDQKVDYRSAKQANTLEIPPDLTQLSRDTHYVAPGASVTASSMNKAPVAATAPHNNNAKEPSLRIEKAGSQRWLVVNQAPEKLWDGLRDFWRDNGFTLVQEQEKLGIMETEWAENRAKLPQDFIRATVGKVFDSLYSTGERDKFRTRIEANAQGGSDIYISHRGMIEVYRNEKKDGTIWQPRPSDVELEAEFLRRLMLKLGTAPEQAGQLLAQKSTMPAANMTNVNGQTTLSVHEGFDRAWRRVGLALDRSGFTVEDRDRNQGIYFVRYVPSEDKSKEEKPGFFANLFSSKKTADNQPQRYRIKIAASGNNSNVLVLNEQGTADTSNNGNKILQLLADDLK